MDKPAVTREEKLRLAQQKEAEAYAAMQDYRDEQAAVDANTARLRALRLAKEAEEAKVAPPTKRAARKQPATRRGTGSH